MKRIPVSSSNVASVGYDEETKTLEVEFHGGALYQYHSVPKSEYQGLLHASSVGKYLHSQIRGVYPHARMT